MNDFLYGGFDHPLYGPLLADRDASPVHFRLCVEIRPTTRHTDDPNKVTCEPCKGMPAFIEARDAQRAEIEGAHLLAERVKLTRAVEQAKRRVTSRTSILRSVARGLTEDMDAEDRAVRALEAFDSPSGSTESAETVGRVPEDAPEAPGPYSWAQPSERARLLARAERFVRDVSIPRMEDHNPWAQRACPCPICTGRGYRKYAPGPF